LGHTEEGLAPHREVLAVAVEQEIIHQQAQEVPARLVKVMLEVTERLLQVSLQILDKVAVEEPLRMEPMVL
jgi:hypothetical protein